MSGLFSDGTAVKMVGEETFRMTRELVDDFVKVDSDSVCAAIKDAFEDTRIILEPAGAMGIAGLKQYVAKHDLQGENLVAITCGANINFDRLRFVAERADAGGEREALFAVTIPEERGSFKLLCESIGHRNVTEFSYRISDQHEAHVLVGLEIQHRGEVPEISQLLAAQGFAALDLVDDELSKQHLRYMIGGRSPLCENERLYRFEFPERPAALMRFLSSMHPDWNISLFHYRNEGADYGRILVGIQVSDEDLPAFSDFINTLGYRYADETANPVYGQFLR